MHHNGPARSFAAIGGKAKPTSSGRCSTFPAACSHTTGSHLRTGPTGEQRPHDEETRSTRSTSVCVCVCAGRVWRSPKKLQKHAPTTMQARLIGKVVLSVQRTQKKKTELGQPPKITDQIGGNRRWGEPRAVSPQMAKLPPQYKTATDAIATTNTMAHIFSAVHRPINCSSSGERAALSSTHEFEADLCLWRLVRADLVRYFGPRHLKQSLARRSPNGFLLLRCFGAPPQDAPPRHTPRDA